MRSAAIAARVFARLVAAVGLCLSATTCRTPSTPVTHSAEQPAAASIPVYVVRRGWHTDVGFRAQDLGAPLESVRDHFPRASYLLFGFGDRRYLLHGGTGDLVLALWPGAGVLLVTALKTAGPRESFDRGDVRMLLLTPEENARLQDFVRGSLSDAEPAQLAPGPYPDSAYYASRYAYSAVRTCNTWVASALRTAGLAVRSSGVVFAWQLWPQISRLQERGAPGG
jgi:uncharacterized protein (TIGR02117 family)